MRRQDGGRAAPAGGSGRTGTDARRSRARDDGRGDHVRRRREELLQAAIAAIAAAGPGATMTRMAAEAGVTKPILYRYFGDRAGLYEAIAIRFVDGMLAELNAAMERAGSPEAVVRAGVDAYLAYVERQPEVYRFLTQRLPAEHAAAQRMVSGFVHRVAREVAAALGRWLEPTGVPPEVPELLGFGVTGMVQLAGELWLDRPTMPRELVVRCLAGTLWGGLGEGVAAAGALSAPATLAGSRTRSAS